MALQLKITAAGRAALVNAANTGTLPVTIAQIGVTATAFTAGSQTALPGELKRLATFGGLAVADDTIHVTLRDDGSDVYSLRGFALYLADGTLFALYGQTEVILEKSAQAMLLLSADVRFVDVPAASLTFGDANFVNPPASSTVAGVTQHATNAEALAGTASNRSIVASALKHVLDSRFGVGAPSAFVKGLLSLATAALVRAALEIKGAALKDEGTGNGLDADLLDGQHGAFYRAWSNMTGVPAEFAPSAHTHAAGDIASGTFANARIAASNVTQHQGALSIGWSQLTNVPSTFAPSTHGHAWSQISGTGQLDNWYSIAPSAKANASHGHDQGDVTFVSSALNVASEPASSAPIGITLTNIGSAASSGYPEFGAAINFVSSTSRRAQLHVGCSTGRAWLRVGTTAGFSAFNQVWTAADFDHTRKADRFGDTYDGLHTHRGHSAPWGSVSTLNTGLRVNMGEASGATWLITAYSGGTFRGGLQILDTGGSFRIYCSADDYAVFSGGTWATGNIPTLPTSKISGLDSALESKAPIASPTFTGTVRAPVFRPTSSRKVKRDIRPSRYSVDDIMALTPVTWAPLANEDCQRRRGGLVAEDTAAIIPEAVDAESDIPGIDYAAVIAALIGAVQELATDVRELRREAEVRGV